MHATRLLLLLLILVRVGAAQVYKITDLGSLGGGANAGEALAVNVLGNVAGESCLDPECTQTHPFLWISATGLRDLGTLPNGNMYAIATGVNDLDQVVGSSAFAQPFSGNTHAFLWSASGGMQDLGTLGCPDITGANGINKFGEVVGTSTIPPCPGGGQDRAFLWTQNEGMQSLGTLPGGTFSFGNAINDLGQAVGYSDCSECSIYHAFLWDLGMQDLGVLPGGTLSVATGINDFGFVAGDSDASSNIGLPHAVLWNPFAGVHDLGTLLGGRFSSAAAVNDFGVVVGNSDSAASPNHGFKRRPNGRPESSATHAFFWRADTGMLDLNDLIRPAHSGWVLVDALAVSSVGQIVGFGMFQDQVHAFLLTPVGRGHGR